MIDDYTDLLDNITLNPFIPFPLITDRLIWGSIDNQISQPIINKANEYLVKTFPVLPATTWLDFTRTGNRTNFQKLVRERRTGLHYLLLAEIIENNNKYLDKIIDIIWMTLEETSWIIPAHNAIAGSKDNRDPLPNTENIIVDLMAGETGASLAICQYFLRDKLDKISPMINQRINREINIRLLTPYLTRNDYWWMGFLHDEKEQINNWNPWINSNILLCTLLIEKDHYRKISLLQKITRSLDKYLTGYPDDSCCDEGPGYWGKAGASAFECLEIMNQISNQVFNPFANKKIINMGQYIYKSHISKNYVTNYADGRAKTLLPYSLIFRFGKLINETNLMRFASHVKSEHGKVISVTSYSIYRTVYELLLDKEMDEYPSDYTPCYEHYYKDTQVLISRSNQLFLSAKGGHNSENHNHNDIGTFMIYKSGYPMLIDLGSMVYTKKTFSPRRYEIFVNQSIYHNGITINQIQQLPGKEYKATDLQYKYENNHSKLSMDLLHAYPKSSTLEKLVRTFEFNKKEEIITVTDQIELSKKSSDVMYTFMTVNKPDIIDNNIIFKNSNEKLILSINYPTTFNYEKITCDDENLIYSWGESIYRVTATINNGFISGDIRLTFTNN